MWVLESKAMSFRRGSSALNNGAISLASVYVDLKGKKQRKDLSASISPLEMKIFPVHRWLSALAYTQ